MLPQDEAAMFKVINEKPDQQDPGNLITSIHYFRSNTQDEAEDWLEAIEQYIEDCEVINKLEYLFLQSCIFNSFESDSNS